MNAKNLALILAAALLFSIIELVRRERLTFKYAVWWIMGSIFAIVCVIFDAFLYQVSDALGFKLTSNFIFFTAICGFVFLSLILTIFLCQQNNRNDRIAQKLGILEQELKSFKSHTHNE